MTTLLKAQQAVTEAERRSAFYRAWCAAQAMGATHANALEELGLSFGRGETETLRKYLAQSIAQRSTLTDSIKRAPAGLLESFEAAILKLGEETGTLDRSLRLLADWYLGQHKLLLRLWSASAYPLFLTLAAAVLLPLPLIFLDRSREYFVAAGTGVAVWFLFGGNVVFLASRLGSRRGKWVRARLARSLATAAEAGAPLDRVIELALGAAASPELEQCVKRVPLTKRRIQPLSETFRGCPYIAEELLGAMRVAESTGDWHNTVGRMGELYEDGF